jgi:hypothetical protein
MEAGVNDAPAPMAHGQGGSSPCMPSQQEALAVRLTAPRPRSPAGTARVWRHRSGDDDDQPPATRSRRRRRRRPARPCSCLALALAVASGPGAGGGVRRGRLVPWFRGHQRLADHRRPDGAAGPAPALCRLRLRPGHHGRAGRGAQAGRGGRGPGRGPGAAGVAAPAATAARGGVVGGLGLLGLYSAGNLVITVGTVSGLLAPSAAWTAAGGVTARAILYVGFFLAGAALFGVLAVWFHRRHQLRWTSAVAGLAGAPLLLAVAPRDPRPLGPAAHLIGCVSGRRRRGASRRVAAPRSTTPWVAGQRWPCGRLVPWSERSWRAPCLGGYRDAPAAPGKDLGAGWQPPERGAASVDGAA